MNRRAALACLFTVASTAMLSACGFHLRGSLTSANLPFKTVYINTADATTLGPGLKRYIEGNGGTTVLSAPEQAEAIIDIMGEAREKIVGALNSQGRVRSYTLHYKLQFRVRDSKNQELLAPTEIALQREISYNESQVLTQSSDEDFMYRDMQNDLIQQIMRRLAAIKPVPPQAQPPQP